MCVRMCVTFLLFIQDGKDYIPLNPSQSSEDDGFSQASSRPPSQEELRLAFSTLPARYSTLLEFLPTGLLSSPSPQLQHV